jgi:hypothetical protein
MDNERYDYESLEQSNGPKVQITVKEVLLLKQDELTTQLKEIDAIIHRLQVEYSLRIDQLQAQKKPLEDALHHVKALLQIEGHYEKIRPNSGDYSATSAIVAGSSITDAAFNLLEELHQPMHYKGIAAQLQERNAYIPGKNPAATLLTRMSRDNRFKHTKKRGMYVLSTWRVRTTRDEPPHKKAILLPQPWELHIGRLQDLVVTGKVKNQFSLFALGIPYGRG